MRLIQAPELQFRPYALSVARRITAFSRQGKVRGFWTQAPFRAGARGTAGC